MQMRLGGRAMGNHAEDIFNQEEEEPVNTKITAALVFLACIPLGCEQNQTGSPGQNGASGRIEGGQQPGQQAEPTVKMTSEMTFEPRTLRITAGQTVRWENTSGLTHTVTADPALAKDQRNAEVPQGAQPFDSGRLAPGSSFTHTFDTPGTYRYFCQPHEEQGMVGEIIVGE